MLKPSSIRVNRQKMGKTPREQVVEGGAMVFSWALDTDHCAQSQAAFRVVVTGAEHQTLMDSGLTFSDQQEYHAQGDAWPRGQKLTLRVFVRGTADEEGSAQCAFYLGDVAFDAEWIGASYETEDQAIYLRREFIVKKPVRNAVLYACGLGYHALTINAREVDDARLDPAMTDYRHVCQYAVIPEVHTLLTQGVNCLGAVLGSGWRRTLVYGGKSAKETPLFGPKEMILMLRITYEDGECETIASDASWTWSLGPITMNSVFMGETYDARLGMPGWNLPGHQGDFRPVALMDAPGVELRPMLIPPVREKAVFRPIAITQPEEGCYIVDFGQNIAGVARIHLPALPIGHAVTLRHAEILDEDGLLYTAPLRQARAEDTYLSDGQAAVWQPRFTYHGFRYVQVCGMRPTFDNIQAIQLYTDLDKASFFRSGSALINAIQHNIVMTERDNMHSILTDCPQRDERMAWMNDATVRFEETPFNFDTGAMFRKIVRDISGGQRADGAISCTSPYTLYGYYPADPVCSSYLVAAWQNYLHNGDLETIRENFDGFAAWEQCLIDHSDDYIVNYSHYGDWASPAYACVEEESAVSSVTPGLLMSTGYSFFNCTLLRRFAALLGRAEDAARYECLAENIRLAMLKKWYHPETCAMATGSQAAQAFSLWLGILPENDRQRAAQLIHDDLVKNDYRITTGNLCTRYLMDALADYGYIDDAYRLITREEYPSFGYMIQQEATTIWERFELKKHAGMNSHNHPMYGAVGSWFYTHLAGIRPTGAGFETVLIEPRIPAHLMSVQALVDTVRGPIQVRWVKRYGAAHLYLDIPAGMTANVRFLGACHTLRGGTHHIEVPCPDA